MHKQDSTKKPDSHSLDEKIWRRIRASKTIQGLAWKIEKAMQAEKESRSLVKMLVEKWAELAEVRQYFPGLKDVFIPDAIFYIEYAHREGAESWPESQRVSAARVYSVLAYISNIVARHEITPGQLKRKYNSEVSRWSETLEVLQLFDVGEVEDGRISTSKKFFTPKDAPAPKPAKKKLVKSTHVVGFDWPYYGVHQDDKLIVEEGATIKPGQLILIKEEEGTDDVAFARVCTITNGRVRTTGDLCTYSDQPLSHVIGPVVEIQHDDCNQTKIKALRKRLAELQEDDEHTLNYTKCFEVEQQIYNLEHPPAEVKEEEIDWPEVIGDE
jgi:hypothetical protein